MSAGRRLSIDADLTLAVGGEEIRVVGYDDLVVVDAPSFAAARALRRDAARLRIVLAALPDPTVTVDLRVRGSSVARFGPDARQGPLPRLVGAAGDLSLGGALLAALKRATARR